MISSRNRITLEIPDQEIKKLERALRRYANSLGSSEAEKLIDKALENAVTPWQKAFNTGVMYNYLEMNTGGLQEPMGNRKIKGTRKKVYGRKVGPKAKGKSGGWRAHFFASPAKHIRKQKKVPFYRIFAAQTDAVISKANENLKNILIYLSGKNFK